MGASGCFLIFFFSGFKFCSATFQHISTNVLLNENILKQLTRNKFMQSLNVFLLKCLCTLIPCWCEHGSTVHCSNNPSIVCVIIIMVQMGVSSCALPNEKVYLTFFKSGG